jgi:hypothetical protein
MYIIPVSAHTPPVLEPANLNAGLFAVYEPSLVVQFGLCQEHVLEAIEIGLLSFDRRSTSTESFVR